jgi:hypothetical protein
MAFLKGKKGTNTLEWIIGGGIVALVIGAAIHTVATGASSEGTEVSDWVSGISVPSVP